MIEEVLAMFSQAGPMRDPLLEKISPRQIDRTIELRSKQEENLHAFRLARLKSEDWRVSRGFLFLGFVVVAVLFLCWMFLYYGKTEQVFNLLAYLMVGGGGVGIGVGINKRNRAASGQDAEDRPS